MIMIKKIYSENLEFVPDPDFTILLEQLLNKNAVLAFNMKISIILEGEKINCWKRVESKDI